MSRVRQYDAEGRPSWSENQPGYRARVSGQRTGGMVFVGGEFVTGTSEADKRREEVKRYKAKKRDALGRI